MKGPMQGIALTPALRSLLDDVLAATPADDKDYPPCPESDGGISDDEDSVNRKVRSRLLLLAQQNGKVMTARALRALQESLLCSRGDDVGTIDRNLLCASVRRSSSSTLSSGSNKKSIIFAPEATSAKKNARLPDEGEWKARMAHLSRVADDRNYGKLTNNISLYQPPTDEITGRSMTYAASIGLNMIVAPISFGAFIYGFGFHVLRGWGGQEGRILLSVICGVMMMFIEMILFVIRSDAVEKEAGKKKKREEKRKQRMFRDNGAGLADSTKNVVTTQCPDKVE